MAIFIFCLLILAVCLCTVHAQTADKSGFSRMQSALLPINSGLNMPLSSLPPATYDEQLGITFTQNFTSLAYNVTAVPQTDSNGYGPAYLLNGISNDGYWYQVGLSYDWPYSSGGYSSGFNFNYEVFNSAGNSIYPANGGGGLQSFSGTVNSGDLVLLNLYFNNGIVYMYAKDWNTSAVSNVTYADSQTNKFIGLSSMGNSHGFFTGLMTEWWHANPYYGDETMVTYSNSSFGLSSAWMWMDEWEPSNRSWSGAWSTYTQVTYSSNPTLLQPLSYNGATEYSSAYKFITGSIVQQTASITLLPADGSISLSNTNEFAVSFTLDEQQQIIYAQNGTLTFTADNGTSIVISGVSNGSSTTEKWVLNSQGTNVTVPAGSTTTFYYYDILSQQVAYAISGGGNPVSPILTYYAAPSAASAQFNQTITTISLPGWFQQIIMVLRGTSAFVNTPILNTAQEQWGTPISSWSISQANQIPTLIIYYHQYQVTAGCSTSDGSIPSSNPQLSGTQYGSNYQLPLTTTNQTTWLDANTPWSTSTIATAISGTERWSSSAGTSGNVIGAITINPIYVHQYYLAVISSYGSPSGSGWYNSGVTASAALSSGAVSGGTGIQYVFSSWSTGGTNYAQSNGITMNSAATTTASWITQYYLTVNSAYGTPSGSSWYNAGSTAYAGVASNTVSGGSGTQYFLTGWSGDSSGSGATSNGITMDAPKTATASWGTQYYLTVTSAYGSASPASGWFDAGSNINEAVTSPVPVASGTQYICTGWTGTGSITSSGNTPSTAFTIIAPTTVNWTWKKQYYLNMATNFGSVAPGSCWRDAGTTVTISATAPAVQNGERYLWNGWSSLNSSNNVDNSVSVTMNGSLTAVASWVHQYMVTVDSLYGSPSPLTGWFNAGADITFYVNSPAPESIITQHVCTGWTGTGSAPATGTTASLHFTINQPSSITWNWQSQLIWPMVLLLTGVPSATVIIGLSIYLLRNSQKFRKRK